MALRLNDNTIDLIRKDPDLFSKLCKELDLIPDSLITTLRRKSRRLTELPVLEVISEHLKKPFSELTETLPQPEIKDASIQ